ncbi:MAG TPA: hypothetical protein ENN69_01010 [Spirochaetia bacterium]|nr:hypothetical protein [Spirochaetia bacterium]
MKFFGKIIPVLFILGLALSCEEGLYTVFDNVVNDDPIDDNSLSNEISVTAMTEYGTDYYIATGKLRRRQISGGGWSSVSIGTSGFVNSVAANGSAVYASIVKNDGTGLLWNATSPPGSAVGTLPAGLKNVLKVKNIGGQILISIQMNDGSFTLYNVSTSSSIATGLTAPITDFTNGNHYVAGDSVYQNGSSITPDSVIYGTHMYLSIYYDSDNHRYYLGTTDGKVFQSDDDTPTTTEWKMTLATYRYYSNGRRTSVRFCSFENLDATTIAVGTQGYGFYTFDSSVPFDDVNNPDPLVHFPDSAKRELYEGAIPDIHVNGATVFFCTMNSGLWRNEWDGSGWGSTWTRE